MATIKDISRETGLSVGTISRIFNNRGYISLEAREKVRIAMKKLNYQPNAVARSLSKSTSNIIAIIVPHLNHPFFSKLTESVEDAVMKRGYNLMVFRSRGDEKIETKMIEKCRENRVCGLILCSGRFSEQSLDKNDFVAVSIEKMSENADFSIQCNNYEGGRLATRLLIEKGCKHILHLAGVRGSKMPADEREKGFNDECVKHGIEHISTSYSDAIYAKLDYTQYIEQALTKYPNTDGIFASSDMIAAQVLQVCAKHGIKVPDDMKVIGFDDTVIASCTTPPLTTIHQPISEMAEMAVSVLISLKEGKATKGTLVMDVQLIERGTT